MSVLAALYGTFRETAGIAGLLTGMQCGMAAVLLHTVFGMTKSAVKKPLHLLIFAVILLAMLVF